MDTRINYAGEKGRATLLQKYYLRPIGNFAIEENEQKVCCCGQPLKKEAFAFFLTNKESKEQVIEPLLTGPSCGQKLAQMIKTTLPPRCTIFDEIGPQRLTLWKFTPLNAEFYRAIISVCGLIKYIPTSKTFLGRNLMFLSKMPLRETETKYLCEFNDRIPNYFKCDMTIPEMHSYVTGKSCTRIDLDFILLRTILKGNVGKIFV
jgi:hypothetical protein